MRIMALLAIMTGLTSCAAVIDGNEWQDSERLSLGKEPTRACFFRFANEKASLDVMPMIERDIEKGPYHRSLNAPHNAPGAWRFCWAMDPQSRPIGFENPSYDVSKWATITVPSSWQAWGANGKGGWGVPLYTNQAYPFLPDAPRVMGTPPKKFTNYSQRNPVGSYRRNFTLSQEELQDDVFLKFDGVDSFFYLWVNGKYVGFSKDSRSPAEFNVSKYVKAGENTVALEVYRYSDGSYLEDQDMFRLSGIFRDTWLLFRPKVRVRDFFVTAKPAVEGDFAGDWIVSTEVTVANNTSSKSLAKVGVTLYEPNMANVAESTKVKDAHAESSIEVAPGADGRCVMTFTVKSPKLWSAETPNCYIVSISLDAGGRNQEFVSSLTGFRVSEIKNGRYYLNGQKIKLKGANRHETDPNFGHYVPYNRHLEDILLLKRANCNAVRNSHYPQSDIFYFMCDLFGIYLVDEANVESHGYGYGEHSLSHRPEWRAATVDRNMSMVERNKNHPSVVIWSFGNEAGPGENFAAASAAIKARDLTRPTHYERDNGLADMDSNQYPSVEWVQWKASDSAAKKPFYISEYAHCMINAMGNLKDYQDAIESSDVILGATIWDFVDQGLYKRNSAGEMIIGFGGDWGDYPNDGQFVMNGVINSDRRLKPAYFEVAHVFQNFSAEMGDDGKTVVLRNKNYFVDGNGSARWCVYVNGKPGKQGTWRLDGLKPQSTMTVDIPKEALDEAAKPGNTVSVGVEFFTGAPGGVPVAKDQVDLPCEAAAVAITAGDVMPKMEDKDGELRFSNGKETIVFSKKAGSIVSWTDRYGAKRISGPIALDAFRAPSSNEIPTAEAAMAEGLRDLKPECVELTPVVDEAGALAFTATVDWKGARREKLVGYGASEATIEDLGETTERNTYFTTVTRWRFLASGAVTAQTEIRPRGRIIELLRIGWRYTAPYTEGANVEYFGNGPYENYPDRKSGAFLRLWKTKAGDFYFPYARNEDSGNRENVRAFSYSGLTVSTLGTPFSFAANPYTPDELIAGVHPGELPDPSKLEIGVYAAVRGLGGASCGPAPMARDIIRSDRAYRLDLAFVPGGELVARSTEGFEFPEDTYVRENGGLSVVSVSSREPGVGEAEFAVDGDPATIWHTQYGVTLGKHPHSLVVDAHKVVEVRGVGLLPRQDGGINGRIKDCSFDVSDDGVNWRPVCSAYLHDGREEQLVFFPKPVKFRYLKLVALSEQRGREWTSLAELRLIEDGQ